MSGYIFNNAEYGTHRLIAEEIGEDNLVLDVGCNKGYLKQLAPQNTFFGIDNNRKDLRVAKENGYQKVYKFDLNNYKSFKIKNKFDSLVFADILEHLVYPDKVLQCLVEKYLKRDGKVIISLPNVANLSIRLNLLSGNFNYVESGILDRTHLHLYTLETAREFITANGLGIIKERFSSNRFGRLIKIFPFLATLLGFNLIFVCQKKS